MQTVTSGFTPKRALMGGEQAAGGGLKAVGRREGNTRQGRRWAGCPGGRAARRLGDGQLCARIEKIPSPFCCLKKRTAEVGLEESGCSSNNARQAEMSWVS